MRVHSLRSAGFVTAVLCLAAWGLGLTVSSAGAVSLPDGRVYELVSPAASGQDANVYVPEWSSSSDVNLFDEHGVYSAGPFVAASNGEAVTYTGDPPVTGGNGNSGVFGGNMFIARRSPAGGWTQEDLQPPGRRGIGYDAFSSDLSVGIIIAGESLAIEGPQKQTNILYSHVTTDGAGGEYNSPFDAALSKEKSGYLNYAGANVGMGGAPAYSHLIFETSDALTSTAIEGGTEQENLYDAVGGQPYLVNVLPDGETKANAIFGSKDPYPDLNHVISGDGSRIFWTDLNTGDLYVRENDTSPEAKTVQVDAAVGGGGRFLTASADGSKVFFVKGDLYEYEVDSGETTDLTPGVEVLGLMGASEDGAYVYYVDASDGLNLWHDGVSTFIATLTGAEGENLPLIEGGSVGDWQGDLGFHTAEVTPDGHNLIFVSQQSLTGYDNRQDGEPLEEVFHYEAGSGELRCVSCNPTGEAPVSTEFNTYRGLDRSIGGILPVSESAVFQPRLMSDDGSRVFFQSGEPLVPQDINGWLDVYEWERDGAGSCQESPGCIYLLSGGVNPDDSYLIGPSATGDDVFITTRAQLLSQDRDDDDNVYDVRVGGVAAVAPPSCSGSGCQGVSPAPPIFATPSSVTFNGVGNFSPPPKTEVGVKAKSLTTAQKLARSLRACRAKRSVRKRSACEANARKRYGPRSKANKRDRRGK